LSRVSVVRKPFTPRDLEADRLSGTLWARLEALSYIHVSSGRERVELLRSDLARPENLRAIEEALMRGDTHRLERLTEAVRIGYIDNVVYGGKVCVPGSTIKGLLRSRLELCPSQGGTSLSCLHTDAPPLIQPPPPGQHGWRHARIWWPSVAEDRGPRCDPIASGDYSLCIVCDLFGAPGVVGRVAPSNFCCEASCCEPRDLPYGERVYAIKPGSTLRGCIHFNSLTLEELGLLLIAMGITAQSTVGVEVLIGKHKYAYRDMGRARFVLEKLVVPARLVETLRSVASVEPRVSGSIATIEGNELAKFVKESIERALSAYPQYRSLHGFSEAKKRDEVIR